MRTVVLILVLLVACDGRRWDGVHDMESIYEKELRERVDAVERSTRRLTTWTDTLSICLNTHLRPEMQQPEVVRTIQDCIDRAHGIVPNP